MDISRHKDDINFPIDFVVITATDIETKALLRILKPCEKETEIVGCPIEAYTYSIGIIANYHIAHIQCEMGSLGPKGSMMVATHAIDNWHPLGVIMIGICFGTDSKSQNIGDVLVAKQIIGYESQKIKESGTIQRSRYHRSGRVLMDRFKALKLDSLQYKINFFDQKTSAIRIGDILSGEKLIDAESFRNELMENHPEVLGGEMEGIGLASACEAKNVEWLLLKAICDFADGNKGLNKEANQSQAAIASTRALEILLTQNSDFSSSFGSEKNGKAHEPAKVNIATGVPNPLFNAYSPEHEPYYVERQFDLEIKRYTQDFDIWVHGVTGIGKTCCLTRVSTSINISKISICLANTGYDYDAVLDEVYQNISIKEGRKINGSATRTEKLIAIIDLISHETSNFLIVFDEAPDESFDPILHLLYDLKKMAVERDLQLKFFISSHSNPFDHLPIEEKFLEIVCFKQFQPWSNIDLFRLASKINEAMKLMHEDTLQLLSTPQIDNPRKMKTVLKQFKAAKPIYNLDEKSLLQKIINDINVR